MEACINDLIDETNQSGLTERIQLVDDLLDSGGLDRRLALHQKNLARRVSWAPITEKLGVTLKASM